MARFEDRVPQNVPGKFYVDWTCIYCDFCVESVPTVFREEKGRGWASVFHQPVTAEELRMAWEMVEDCPTDSIGADGDVHDWSSPATPEEPAPIATPLTGSCAAKPWWKFW